MILICLLWCEILTATQLTGPYLNRGNGAEPDSLNIHQAQGLNSHNVLFDMYEGLMTLDAYGRPVYGVAMDHQVSENYTLWDFQLKPQAKWSDGKPVVANDFISAWHVAVAPATAAPYRQLFDNLINQGTLNVSSDNDHHIKIQLNQPDAGLLDKLVLPIFYPTPTHSDQPLVSNGAFYLQKWDIQERIILAKNPYFHTSSEVLLEGVNYWVTENQNSELLKFRAGELDITETIPDNKITWLQKHLAKELRISPYYGTFFLGLNLNNKYLRDGKLRRALSKAIDRRILVDKVLKTGQVPANQIIPPAADSRSSDTGFDPAAAQSLLQESAFNVATDRLEILYNNSDNQKKVALAVAAMWRQNLGIRSQLRNQEWKVFVNTRKGQKKQVFRSGWIADYHDPLNFLELFHSQSHFNFYAFVDAEYDQTLSQLRQSHDQSERALLINKAEHIIALNTPVIPLYHYVSRHLVKTHVSGFIDNKMDRHLSRYMSK